MSPKSAHKAVLQGDMTDSMQNTNDGADSTHAALREIQEKLEALKQADPAAYQALLEETAAFLEELAAE